ncbi:unnamed protein product [Absidia cylindrospora]
MDLGKACHQNNGHKDTLSTGVSLGNVADSNGVNSESRTNDDNDGKCSNDSKDETENDTSEDMNDSNITPISHKKDDADDDDVGLSNHQPCNPDRLDATSTTTDSKSSTMDDEEQTKDIELDDDDNDNGNHLAGTAETQLELYTQETAQQHPAEIEKPTSINVLPTDVNETATTSTDEITPPIFDDDINSTLAPVSPSSAYSSNTTSEAHTELDEKNTPTALATTDNSDKDRVLAQREQQLLQAMETIAKLHDQIHGLQQDGDQATAHINSLQKRLQDQSTSQVSSRNVKKLELSIQDMTKQLDSKEEQIQGLLREGNKNKKKNWPHDFELKTNTFYCH